MQMRSSERVDSMGNNGFFEAIDFPTEEELLAVLEASLEQSPWLPRVLQETSSELVCHWQELATPETRLDNSDEPYLAWESPAALHQDVSVEPDFLASFAKFLTDRLLLRMQEVVVVQRQLQAELARFKG